MLAGAAGAPLVPWRALDKALIFLPNAPKTDLSKYFTSVDAWFLNPGTRELLPTYQRSKVMAHARFTEILRPGMEKIWLPVWGEGGEADKWLEAFRE